ncbi:MAG: hypothetical protein QM756_08565 [Polyangiaceae bacterium]
MADTIGIANAQKTLGLVWYVMPLPAIAILASQTFFGHTFEGKESEIWGWFCPQVVPSLTLISSRLFVPSTERDSRRVPRFRFRLALAASVLYLLAIDLIIFNIPKLVLPLATLQRTGLWLGIFQGVAISALGSFFVPNPAPQARN